MASTTSFLNLKLLGASLADKETYFEDWRLDINGETGESNMEIIDEAVESLSNAIDSLGESIDDITDNIGTYITPITNEQIDALFDDSEDGGT